MKAKPLAAAVLCMFALGSAAKTAWEFNYAPFKGEYVIYAGGIGDALPPTSTDKKLSFFVTGKMARDVFDAIGPDLKNACGSGDGVRMRQRNDERIACSFHPKDGYQCYFGFDLVTGRSIAGVVC